MSFPIRTRALLAGLIGAFVNEKELADTSDKRIVPRKLQDAFKIMVRKLKPFSRQMRHAEFQVRPLYFRAAVTIYLWGGRDVVGGCLPDIGNGGGEPGHAHPPNSGQPAPHPKPLPRFFPRQPRLRARAVETILREPVLPPE